MNNKTKDFIAMFLCIFFLTISFSLIINGIRKNYAQNRKREVRELMEKEAVLSGHAEWIAGTNGEPVFSWKSRFQKN